MMYPIWIIVPKKDNHYQLAIDKDGNYYNQYKPFDTDNKIIAFLTEIGANNFISTNHLEEDYQAECSWRASPFICPDCGDQIKLKADWDGIIGQCANPLCKKDWRIKDGKIERYFFG